MITFIKDLLASVADTIKSLWSSIFKTVNVPKEEVKDSDFWYTDAGSDVVLGEAKCQEEIQEEITELFDLLDEARVDLEDFRVKNKCGNDLRKITVDAQVLSTLAKFKRLRTYVAKLYGTENVSKTSLVCVAQAVECILNDFKMFLGVDGQSESTYTIVGEGNVSELRDILGRLASALIKLLNKANNLNDLTSPEVDDEFFEGLKKYTTRAIVATCLESIQKRSNINEG